MAVLCRGVLAAKSEEPSPPATEPYSQVLVTGRAAQRAMDAAPATDTAAGLLERKQQECWAVLEHKPYSQVVVAGRAADSATEPASANNPQEDLWAHVAH